MMFLSGRKLPATLAVRALIGVLWIFAAATARADGAGDLRAPGALASLRRPLGMPVAPDYLAILRQAPATEASAPFLGALDWYRTVLSPLDGKRCAMAPTCSIYAQQAFREYGPLWGFVLTADRLLHEADEQPRVRSYVLRDERHYLDPLAANTYWW
jgi:hypothetical protein